MTFICNSNQNDPCSIEVSTTDIIITNCYDLDNKRNCEQNTHYILFIQKNIH